MLFQIEEPDGSPLDDDGPGLAVGIDLAGPRACVAIAVGGNAEILAARDGAPGPETASLRDATGVFRPDATTAALLNLRGCAERALARPVTHAVIAVPQPLDPAAGAALAAVAAAAGLAVLRVMSAAEAVALAPGAPPGGAVAHGAAIAAEDASFALLRP